MHWKAPAQRRDETDAAGGVEPGCQGVECPDGSCATCRAVPDSAREAWNAQRFKKTKTKARKRTCGACLHKSHTKECGAAVAGGWCSCRHGVRALPMSPQQRRDRDLVRTAALRAAGRHVQQVDVEVRAETDAQRLKVHKACSVPCPSCDAPAGASCRAKSPHFKAPRGVWAHGTRYRAAARSQQPPDLRATAMASRFRQLVHEARSRRERVTCNYCAADVAGYVPREGDGSMLFVQKHGPRSKPCPGSNLPPAKETP